MRVASFLAAVISAGAQKRVRYSSLYATGNAVVTYISSSPLHNDVHEA